MTKIIDNEVLEVTPFLARQLLDKNYNHNRPVKERTIRKWRSIIESGQFIVGSQIRLAQNGTTQVLIDGQHRLTAIEQTQKPQICSIISLEVDNMAIEYAITDSCVRSRTPADSLQAIFPSSGLSSFNINKMIAAIKIIKNNMAMSKNSHDWTVNRPAMSEIAKPWLPVMAKYETFIVGANPKGFGSKLHRASVLAFGLISVKQQPIKAFEFWSGLALDEGLYNDDPRRLLRKYLLNSAAYSSIHARLSIGMIISSWNGFCSNSKLKVLRPSLNHDIIHGIELETANE